MPEPSPQDLADLLAHNELRIRTGILELPIDLVGGEIDLAVALGVGHRDICDWLVTQTPDTRLHLGLSYESIIRDLAFLLSDMSLPGYCVWVSGLDVLLAAIPFGDRKRLWGFLRNTFRQSRGLLLSMPQKATDLLPEDERSRWLEYNRLSTWTNRPVKRDLGQQ